MREIESLSVMEKVLMLSEWPLFEGLATDEIALIAARTTEVEYETGEQVGPDSPNAGSVHFVVKGSVELISDGRAIRRVAGGGTVRRLTEMEDTAAEEMLRMLQPTHALLLSGQDIERSVSDYPEFAMALIRSLQAAVRGLERTLENRGEEAE